MFSRGTTVNGRETSINSGGTGIVFLVFFNKRQIYPEGGSEIDLIVFSNIAWSLLIHRLIVIYKLHCTNRVTRTLLRGSFKIQGTILVCESFIFPCVWGNMTSFFSWQGDRLVEKLACQRFNKETCQVSRTTCYVRMAWQGKYVKCVWLQNLISQIQCSCHFVSSAWCFLY